MRTSLFFSILFLNFAFNSHSMKQELSQLMPMGTIVPKVDYYPEASVTSINSGNKESNFNDCRNTCSPTNKNILNFSLFGAGLSQLSALNIKSFLNPISSIISFITNHKKISAAAFIGGLYFLLNSRLLYLYSKLKTGYWSQWRSNLTLGELYQIPRQILYNDLLANIQTKYISYKNFQDNLAPLACFLKEIENEEYYISQYKLCVKILKKYRIVGYVFFNPQFYKKVGKRLYRLKYIKSAFLNWYAEHKLNNSEKEILVRRFPKVKDILNSEFKHTFLTDEPIPPILPEESTEHILENIIVV